MSIHQLVTPEWLQKVYLYGIDLTNDFEEAYPDEQWYQTIDMAVAMAEAEFDVVLRHNRRFTSKERHDGLDWESESWFLKALDHRPVQRVLSLGLRFGSFAPATIPESWVHIASPKAGLVQIIPGPDGLSGSSFFGTGLLGTGMYPGRRYTPAWFEYTYEAGFEKLLSGHASGDGGSSTITLSAGTDDDGNPTTPAANDELKSGVKIAFEGDLERIFTVKYALSSEQFLLREQLPAAVTNKKVIVLDYDPTILDFIGLTAALLPLDTAGDLILGAGISSQSISIDGLSQSISSTSGVENSGYGARAVQYGKRLEKIVKSIKRRYRAHSMMVV